MVLLGSSISERFKNSINYISIPRYTGNFSLCGFLKGRTHLFIVLAFFCAFGFYISSLLKGTSISTITVTNLQIDLVNNPASVFIKLSMLATFTIIILISGAILFATIAYGNKKSIECASHQKFIEHKLNFPEEVISVIKRYSFVIVFYCLVFYDISYLILTYMPDLKIGVLIISILFQLTIVYKILDEVALDELLKKSMSSNNLLIPKISVILISILIIYLYLTNQYNILFLIFLFPICLIIVLVYLFVFEVLFTFKNIYNILLDKPIELPKETDNHPKSAYTHTNAVVVAVISIILLLVLIGAITALNMHITMGQSNPLHGKWASIDGIYVYHFYDDATYIKISNSTHEIGDWENNNNQYFLHSIDGNRSNNDTLFFEDNKLYSFYNNISLIKISD